MKILIDTNIYLDFYRSTTHSLKLLDELANHYDKIILTEQIIQEFQRSRESVIKEVKNRFEKESKLEDIPSAYLQNLTIFNELVAIQKQYREKRLEVIAALNDILISPANDPVASSFNDFVNKSIRENRVFNTTEGIIAKAWKRKLVGNPPISNKYSIGDEINWEIVLENIKEDIIIVGRDNTYTDNFSFLKTDFHRQTGRFISRLTKSITEALEVAGITTSEELKDTETKMMEDIQHFGDYWTHAPR